MDWGLIFLKGILAGLAIAAPVGPVGVLCVQRTIHHGRLSGLISGFGAALADAVYGCIAAFSLTLVADWLSANEQAFRLGGGLLLLVLGARLVSRSNGSVVGADGDEGSKNALSLRHHSGQFFSTFALTATNPITIVAFLGIFAFIDVGEVVQDGWLAGWLVSGVFAGSWFWWFAIAFAAERFGRQLQAGGLVWVARISGCLLLGFGAYGLVSWWSM